ncbi:MAG: hypothetical protein JZU65_20450, partial [Chlorobium sp.]|nr:hypothetical protein [Chlorobium sp.]
FSLLLMGRGNEFLPHIVYSAQLMGEEGIGVGIKNGLGRFALETITAGEATVFDESDAMLNNGGQPTQLHLAEPPKQRVEALRVTLHTPLRLKQDNILQQDLPFHLLIRAALRRISALEAAYGEGEPPLDYAGLVRR